MKKIIILIFVILVSLTTKANVKTSINTGSWSDSTIWSPVGVPQLTDTVKIALGDTVTIEPLFTAKPYALNVYGDFINKSILYLPGDLNVTGHFSSERGSKIIFNGSDSQTVTGSGIIDFYDMDN